MTAPINDNFSKLLSKKKSIIQPHKQFIKPNELQVRREFPLLLNILFYTTKPSRKG